MKCPHCHETDQNGRYCTKCGKDMINIEEMDDEHIVAKTDRDLHFPHIHRPAKKTIAVFMAGSILALFLVTAVMSAMTYFSFGKDKKVSVCDNMPNHVESDAVKNLRGEAAIKPNSTLAQDQVVGYWKHYDDHVTIDKISDNRYRWILGARTYLMTFEQDHYRVTCDEKTFYNFSFAGSDELTFRNRDGENNNSPEFQAGYSLLRIGQDGGSVRTIRMNEDIFRIIGRTYGELAGTFGPGSLSVVDGKQFIVFRGDGGNFAVAFEGDTVPLAHTPMESNQSNWHVQHLANETGDNPLTNTPPDKGESSKAANPATDQTESSSMETPRENVKIPDPAQFPATNAVATGVVWIDLGFLVQDCPSSMTLDYLSKILNVQFKKGAPSNVNSGFTFYHQNEGVFAATLRHDNRTYRISGYGRNLDRAKTVIFLELL